MPELKINLRYLYCALSVAELGSLRRAALALGLPQSTVSRRVQLLEHRLGFPLFNRNRLGAEVTDAGSGFLKEAIVGAHHLNRAAELAVAVIRGGRGNLNVGISASLTTGFLHRLLRSFRKQNPDIHVMVREGTSHDALRGLVDGEPRCSVPQCDGLAGGRKAAASRPGRCRAGIG